MPWNRILFATTILSFGLLSLLLLHLSQEPLCIESRVVERIDKLSLAPSLNGPETVYRCSFRRQVPYSGYFAKNLPSWTERIQKTERFLESIEPFYRRVQIAVVPQQDYFFQVHNHQIRIGERMLELPGHLERALIKIWYRERSKTQFESSALMEEVIVDFLLFAREGSLKVQDLQQKMLDWKTRPAQGPFILMSQASYCESPWRKSEHYFACESIIFDVSKISATMADLSLRSLLTQSWISSFLKLSGVERYSFIKNFSNFLRARRGNLNLERDGEEKPSAMQAMVRHLKEAQLYITQPTLTANEIPFQKFQRSYLGQLHDFGFYDSAIEAQVDFIYVSQNLLDSDSPGLKSLAQYSKENPGSQVAIRDAKSLWVLPNRYPLALDSFSQIKSRRMALQVCGAYDFAFVLSYAELTEKLLVVNDCENKNPVDYAWYLKEGIESFSSHHPSLAFVQYHLPSLAMKAAELKNIKNVYDIIQPQWEKQTVLQALGWQKVQWNESAKAFKPQAVIEGIEWFRTSSAPKSSL